MKRIMSFFLAVLLLGGLLLSAIPARAAADEVETVPVHIYDETDTEIWSGNAPKGEHVAAWLDANAAEHVAKTGFTIEWYSKDSGSKYDADATFNGWTNVLIKYQEEKSEEQKAEPETVSVHVYDEANTEIWSGTAPKGEAIVAWLDANAASHIVKTGYTSDKWYNKDTSAKFETSAVFSGPTNVQVKYQAVVVDNVDPSKTASYVDVILNKKTENFVEGDYHHCILENGKIKQSDIDAIAEKIKGKGISAWTCKLDGVTVQSDMLSKFDFSTLTDPINIFPIFTDDNAGTNNKFPYKVYLNIYKDNKVDTPHKTINITNGIALDGKVTLSEVKSILASYYVARTSSGIKVDGMYLAEDNWVSNFVNNTKVYSTIEDTNEMRQKHEVNINVMITNANTKGTPVNDSPKTGDHIGAFVAIMVVSAAAAVSLVALYKKTKKSAAQKH